MIRRPYAWSQTHFRYISYVLWNKLHQLQLRTLTHTLRTQRHTSHTNTPTHEHTHAHTRTHTHTHTLSLSLSLSFLFIIGCYKSICSHTRSNFHHQLLHRHQVWSGIGLGFSPCESSLQLTTYLNKQSVMHWRYGTRFGFWFYQWHSLALRSFMIPPTAFV